MKKIILVILILIISLVLSACGPESGDAVPIKFKYTSQDAGQLCSAGQIPPVAPSRMPDFNNFYS